MHYRRKHPTGKPQLRHRTSEWSYPYIEKGSYKHVKYNIVKKAASAKQQIKEYYAPIVQR